MMKTIHSRTAPLGPKLRLLQGGALRGEGSGPPSDGRFFPSEAPTLVHSRRPILVIMGFAWAVSSLRFALGAVHHEPFVGDQLLSCLFACTCFVGLLRILLSER